jgi:hypothetical protein
VAQPVDPCRTIHSRTQHCRGAEALRLNIELEAPSWGDEAADAARMVSVVAAFGVEVAAGVPGFYKDLAAQANP